MTLVFFIEVARSMQTPPNRRWSPSQGSPPKGQAPSQVILWIASGLPHAQRKLPVIFTVELFGQTAMGLVPSDTW